MRCRMRGLWGIAAQVYSLRQSRRRRHRRCRRHCRAGRSGGCARRRCAGAEPAACAVHAPTRRASVPIRHRRGCSSIRCTPRRLWCSARRTWPRRWRQRVWARRSHGWNRRPLIDWPEAAARQASRCCGRCSNGFIDELKATVRSRRTSRASAPMAASCWRSMRCSRRCMPSSRGRSRRLARLAGRICATRPAPRSRCSRHRTSARCCSTCFLQWLADRSLGIAQQRARDGRHAHRPDRRPCRRAWTRPAAMHGAGRATCSAGLSIGAPPDLFNPRGQDWGLTGFSPRALVAGRVRAVPGDGARGAAQHRRRAHRPCHGPDAAVADPAGRRSRPMAPTWPIRSPTCCGCWRWNRSGIARSWSARISAPCRLASAKPGDRRPARHARAVVRAERPGVLPHPTHGISSAIAMTSTHDLPTVAGWWHGSDIATRAACGRLGVGVNEADVAAERATDRRRLWQAFVQAGLAQRRAAAARGHAAGGGRRAGVRCRAPRRRSACCRSRTCIGVEEQPNLPGTIDEHPNWRRRLTREAESLLDEPRTAAAGGAAGGGAAAAMNRATRDDAAAVASRTSPSPMRPGWCPTWRRLGSAISTRRRFSTARAGSMHGYDVIDPTRVNPELGGEAGLRGLVAALRGAGLGLIVDIVPNHMAAGGMENPWWADVLRHGRASRYATFLRHRLEQHDPACTARCWRHSSASRTARHLRSARSPWSRDERRSPVIRYYDTPVPDPP